MFTARRTNIARAVPWQRPINWRHPHARGLVGHWMPSLCRYNLNLLDLTRRHDGTLTNMDASNYIGDAERGVALDLDGTADYVDMGQSAAHDLTSQFTFSLWTKWGGGGGSVRTILTKRATVNNWPYAFGPHGISRVLYLYSNTGSTANVFSTDTLSTGVWTHIAVTRMATIVRFYFNGIEDSGGAQTLAAGASDPDADLYLGAQNNGSSAISFYRGRVDDIRIYNRALSAAEIWNIAHEPWPEHLNVLGARRVVSAPQAAASTILPFMHHYAA